MSTPKKISEVPTVDIGKGTPILAPDASGSLGKGLLPEASWQQRRQAAIESNGKWHRIADVNKSGAGFIALTGSYTNSRPTPCLLAVAFDAHGGNGSPNSIRRDAKLLAGVPDRMTKIRFVVDEFNSAWKGHIDMFIAKSSIMPRVEDGIHSKLVALVQSYIRDTAAFGKEVAA